MDKRWCDLLNGLYDSKRAFLVDYVHKAYKLNDQTTLKIAAAKKVSGNVLPRGHF